MVSTGRWIQQIHTRGRLIEHYVRFVIGYQAEPAAPLESMFGIDCPLQISDVTKAWNEYKKPMNLPRQVSACCQLQVRIRCLGRTANQAFDFLPWRSRE